MLAPVGQNPPTSSFGNRDEERPSGEKRVRREAVQRWAHVDCHRLWHNREQPEIEQSVDVPSQQQSAPHMMLTDSRIAVQMARLERRRRSGTGECASCAVLGEQRLSEVRLTDTNPDGCVLVPPRQAAGAERHPGQRFTLGLGSSNEIIPSEGSETKLRLGALTQGP